MFTFQQSNYVKLKQQTQKKLEQLQKLEKKIVEMNNKITYQGYEKINSVMMRKVQIKHTSEFMIKLNDEFFAQVKCKYALEYLNRKKSQYEEVLKTVKHKVELLDKKIKKSQNQQAQKQMLDSFAKNTMEVIGQNQQGDPIFNIIEVEGEQDTDISEWSKQNKTQAKKEGQGNPTCEDKAINSKNIQSSANPQVNDLQDGNALQSKNQEANHEKEQYEQDLLLNDQFGSEESDDSSLPEVQQEERKTQKGQKVEVEVQNMANTSNNKQKSREPLQKFQRVEQAVDKKQQKEQKAAKRPQVKQQSSKSMKTQTVQPTKPISKFKLERMKQKQGF